MRRALLVLFVLVPTLAGCMPAVGTWTNVDPVVRALRSALADLDAAPGLRVTGTTGAGSVPTTVDLRVTGGGEAVGTVSQAGKRADVLVVDGVTYLRAGKEFWGATDPRADVFAGKWVEANDAMLGVPVQDTLAPALLSEGLRDEFVRDTPAAAGPPAATTIDGARAWRASAPGGEVYVTAEKPHRILRVDAPLAAGERATRRVRLDVRTETEESAAEAMGKVGLGVAQLAGGVYDSGVRISFVGKLNAPCGQSGCNVSAVVKNESASAAVTVVLQGRVTAGASLLATCASPGKSISAGKTAPISCQAGGAKWVTFYRRATRPSRAPRTTPYLVQGIAVATAKPPRSATCSIEAATKGKASPAPPCPKPTITDDGFDHSLKHAKEWWGRRTLTDADVAEWRRMVETAQRSTKRFPWSSRSTLTTAHLTRVGGRYFVAQFDRKTGELVTAVGPNPGQVREMLKLLGT